jgi:transcriptional regulator with XRE-family HTH domain
LIFFKCSKKKLKRKALLRPLSREKICKEFGISKATISQISFSNLRAHLMSLGEDIEAFDSLKKLERIFIKKNIEESQSKQTNITKKFPVNQLKLK